jgi:hypothetical protein
MIFLKSSYTGTWEQFVHRLNALFKRFDFSNSFIESELKRGDDYMVSKTQSKSILAHMKQMVIQLEFDCSRFDNYEVTSRPVR